MTPAQPTQWDAPAAVEVKDRMFFAVAMLRVVVLLNAVGVNLFLLDEFEEPAVAYVSIAVMVAWTGFAALAYRRPAWRRWPLLVADLAVAVALFAATPLGKGPDFDTTVPGFWVIGALFAWSIQFRLLGGLFAGLLLAGVDLGLRSEISQSNYGNAFLLVIGGPVVGYMGDALQRMAIDRDAAQREVAAATERTRLARVVHDGVLQVLALVQRRGSSPDALSGDDLAELGRLAGEQERELRTLIREHAAPSTTRIGTIDLAAALRRLEHHQTVTVATPASPVPLPSPMADEVLAVVGECLANIAHHVGPAAPAWVLLTATSTEIELSIRDEGPGIAAGRLDEAAADGHLGVSQSIRGRIADLGGTADLTTGSFGTEWEFTIPRA